MKHQLEAVLSAAERVYAEFREHTHMVGRQQLMVQLLELDRYLMERVPHAGDFDFFSNACRRTRESWDEFIRHCLAQTGNEDSRADRLAGECLAALRAVFAGPGPCLAMGQAEEGHPPSGRCQ